MITRAELISRIGKSKTKARAREMNKDLNYLCSSFNREVRFASRISSDTFCGSILFAINAVSIIEPAIGYYLLACVGYNDTRRILKSIRRHDRKKLRRH